MSTEKPDYTKHTKLRCAAVGADLLIAIGATVELEAWYLHQTTDIKVLIMALFGIVFYYFALVGIVNLVRGVVQKAFLDIDLVNLVRGVVQKAFLDIDLAPNPYRGMSIVQAHQFITDRLKTSDHLPKDYKGALDYMKERSEAAAAETSNTK